MAHPIWIGNTTHRELHRVEKGKRQPRGCQLDDVPDKHQKRFRTAKDALASGYDVCAYCTRKFRSRR